MHGMKSKMFGYVSISVTLALSLYLLFSYFRLRTGEIKISLALKTNAIVRKMPSSLSFARTKLDYFLRTLTSKRQNR